MENNINHDTAVETPRLIKYAQADQAYSYDTTEETRDFQVLAIPPQENQASVPAQAKGKEFEAMNEETKPSVSVSLPFSPVVMPKNNKRVMFSGEIVKEPMCYSQPIPKGFQYPDAFSDISFSSHNSSPNIAANNKSRDIRYDSFKTWSGKLERQITMLRGKSPKPALPAEENNNNVTGNDKPLSVDRYFDALQGPELESLRESEEILLPQDKRWPFLLRFPISSFGICLGVSSQAILWKTLATARTTEFLHISLKINLILWFIAIALVASIFTIYLQKIIFSFEAVRREYYHPIRVNFFFAPWIAILFLALGAPPSLVKDMHPSSWYILMVPIVCLELKIYGQWMSGGQRRLSKVANPSNHLSVVGNFVGALLGATMGLKEGPIFFFAIGLAHYVVLFVTLYQRLPTNETLPKELHPVFFLFVAAPSVASMAWARIQGSFDYGSRISYFIAMFLYFSLAVRIDFFRGFKFSLAWWAYTFPMTGAAIATIRYSEVVTNVGTKAMCVILSLISTSTVIVLLVSTVVHAFILQDLFRNDMAIAISGKTPHRDSCHNHFGKWFLGHHNDQINNEIDNFVRFTKVDNKSDVEALDNKNNQHKLRVFPSEN